MTTPPESTYLELAYSSIRIFGNDGTIDMSELHFLLGLALRDNEIDEDEKRVLRNIFDQAAKTRLSRRVEERIHEIRRLHGI